MNDLTAAAFDADAFMNASMNEALETEVKLCPEGSFRGMIGDFTADAFQVFDFEYKKGSRAGEQGSMLKFNLPFVILDDKARAALAKDANEQLIVQWQMILD